MIPESAVDGIFEPFRRLRFGDRITDVRESPGGQRAGLGLSIVRSIATAHHGDVRAVARPGGGLTVTFVVPSDQ